MQIKCLTCGANMDVESYSQDVFTNNFCPGVIEKTTRINYMGVCQRCGTRLKITGEQKSLLDLRGKKEG